MLSLRSDRSALRVVFGAIVFTGSVLAGQFGFSRWFPGLPEGMTQIRLFATVAAILAFLPELRRCYRDLFTPSAVVLATLCAYLVLRGLFGGGEQAFAKEIDIAFFIVQVGLIILVARNSIARATVAAALIFSALCLLPLILQPFIQGAVTAQSGFGRGGAIGSITFNRVTFLALCTIFCVYPMIRTAVWMRAVIFFLGTILLFGTWGSLQKAAIVGSLLVLACMLAAYICCKQWHAAILAFGISVVALSPTIVLFKKDLSGRFASSLSISSFDGTGEIIVDPKIWREGPAETDKSQMMTGLSSFFDLKLRYCYFKGATTSVWTPGMPLRCYERVFVDQTDRLSLWLEALRGWVAQPIFGNGLGSYHVVFIQPDMLTPDEYRYPHNLFLEVAFEGGTIGFLVLIGALMIALYTALRTAAPSTVAIPVLGVAGFIGLSMLFAGNFYDSRLFWLSLVMLSSWQRSSTP